jgi:pimeloyl-ACP methyl ester carboxylesterase
MTTPAYDVPLRARHERFANDLPSPSTTAAAAPAVLVLHGGGGPLTVARFVEAMSAHARVIAPVHPGFAGTPRPEGFDSVEQIADAYVALLERLELPTCS